MYDAFKDQLLSLLKAPTRPPDPPAGSESSVQVFRADPNFLKLRLMLWGGGFAVGILLEVLMIVVDWGDKDSGDHVTWLGWLLLFLTIVGAIGKYFLIRIDYDMRYYVVTDRSLRIREGALLIQESTYTFANVQNLKINQGPLERVLGLANLLVETAGGSGSSSGDQHGKNPFSPGHEGRLRGIANAREVRDQILVLLRQYRDAGLGDPEDRAAPQATGAGFSAEAIERLREIHTEVRQLGDALARQ